MEDETYDIVVSMNGFMFSDKERAFRGNVACVKNGGTFYCLFFTLRRIKITVSLLSYFQKRMVYTTSFAVQKMN